MCGTRTHPALRDGSPQPLQLLRQGDGRHRLALEGAEVDELARLVGEHLLEGGGPIVARPAIKALALVMERLPPHHEACGVGQRDRRHAPGKWLLRAQELGKAGGWRTTCFSRTWVMMMMMMTETAGQEGAQCAKAANIAK